MRACVRVRVRVRVVCVCVCGPIGVPDGISFARDVMAFTSLQL